MRNLIGLEKSEHQPLRHQRVVGAYLEKRTQLLQLLVGHHLNFVQGFHLFLRIFKLEQQVEVWIKDCHKASFQLLCHYPFAAFSGQLGPKRKEKDRQIPEGLYEITHFNPESKFHLSLRLNYPNAADLTATDKSRAGSDIYIHGGSQSIGCISITDDKIKELYILALEAKKSGQKGLPVHIFPTRLTLENLTQIEAQFPQHQDFWRDLKKHFDYFEASKTLPLLG